MYTISRRASLSPKPLTASSTNLCRRVYVLCCMRYRYAPPEPVLGMAPIGQLAVAGVDVQKMLASDADEVVNERNRRW